MLCITRRIYVFYYGTRTHFYQGQLIGPIVVFIMYGCLCGFNLPEIEPFCSSEVNSAHWAIARSVRRADIVCSLSAMAE